MHLTANAWQPLQQRTMSGLSIMIHAVAALLLLSSVHAQAPDPSASLVANIVTPQRTYGIDIFALITTPGGLITGQAAAYYVSPLLLSV